MPRKTLDIHSKARYPLGDLSNFAAHRFTIDGVQCESMEGFLQSLKFRDVETQRIVCKMIGGAAKKAGQNEHWQARGVLWWKGVAIDRDGRAYQRLLDRAYRALSENQSFRDALMATGFKRLTHTIGKTEKTDTILTIDEYCGRLTRLRRRRRIPHLFASLKHALRAGIVERKKDDDENN